MKRVGIVTFYDHDNYGALLQAYALKKKVGALGAESVFLSFGDGKTGGLPGTDNAPDSPLIRKILAETKRRSENFSEFRSRFLPVVPFHERIEEEFDAFIAGSDQIWNSEITGGDERYLLSFAPDRKKIAYAASFGRNELRNDEKEWMKDRLKGFQPYLSVRESTGASLVREMTGVDAEVCPDPVLITKEDDWRELTARSGEPPYLLLIMVQNDPVLFKTAKQAATEKDLAFKAVTASYFPMAGFEPWSGVTVENWVSLVQNASYVVSSSFHGIAFSLIFHRPFTFSPLKKELASRNTRVTELLSSLSLSERLSRWDDSIDWEDVETKRVLEIKRATDFLQKALMERGVL